MEYIICNTTIDTSKTTLRDCKETIEKCRDNLDSTLNSISEAWQGADATKYIDKMRDDYLFSFNGLLEGLEKCVKYLEEHVQTDYNKQDENWAGKEIDV